MAEIRTIAVIGAGALGREIAYASVLAGYRTILEDILPVSLRNAAAELREHLARAANVGSVSESEAKAAFSRLEYAATVEQAAREADMVIESVPDEMESKIEIFTLLDKICRPATILASNTSSLSVTEIASVTYRAPKILGMRFANSASGKLLEMTSGRETSDETTAACVEVARRLGRKVVMVADR
ncbi:MAG TPA: 3-hydroxyacyl-CoA dehydrogenase NAD-binding domain-containing protein [Candidatus Angelobacter sp.]|nr:3-hydroxyacyl-CoA dehydrogenase NAD-binding domain-containing protein [Candidatus Angelobacter sp.]